MTKQEFLDKVNLTLSLLTDAAETSGSLITYNDEMAQLNACILTIIAAFVNDDMDEITRVLEQFIDSQLKPKTAAADLVNSLKGFNLN